MRIHIADCPSHADTDILVEMALAQAIRIRPERVAARLLGAVTGGGGDPVDTLERAADLARASLELERMVVAAVGPVVDLGRFLDRFATLRLMASGVIGRIDTCLPSLPADARLARGLALVACELLQVVEGSAVLERLHVQIAVERDGGGLLLAIAVMDHADQPVPTRDGAAALARAERLVHSLDGTISRGVKDGMMLFGVVLGVVDEDAGGGAA